MESVTSSIESWEIMFARLEQMITRDRQEIGKLRKLVAIIGGITCIAPPSAEMDAIKKLIKDECCE
jgi:hypothetical protein